MKLEKIPGGYALYKEKTIIGTCQARPTEQGADVTALTIVPEWRRKGYGSYLLKEVLRSLGGYDKESARGQRPVPPPHPRPDGREACAGLPRRAAG